MPQLFSHREDVDALNAAQLAALPGDAVRFSAQDDGSSADALNAACPVRGSLAATSLTVPALDGTWRRPVSSRCFLVVPDVPFSASACHAAQVASELTSCSQPSALLHLIIQA